MLVFWIDVRAQIVARDLAFREALNLQHVLRPHLVTVAPLPYGSGGNPEEFGEFGLSDLLALEVFAEFHECLYSLAIDGKQ